jgi:pimeloyl-ACP methyl ester carboxylesterase
MSDAPPAYGYTPREHSEILERFVDRLSLTDLTIMVQDWGGPIGLGFGGRRPELVCRLICLPAFTCGSTTRRARPGR